jgi:hypothetical protein
VQLRWLERELEACSSRWFDRSGTVVEGQGRDRPIVITSHHNSWTMTNPMHDDHFPGPHHGGHDVVELLLRFPNVVLWANGHSHENRIVPHRSPHAEGTGFWEVNTASCIDFGQQSRTIELVDNGDGTLSIIATVVDHAAPVTSGPARDGSYDPAMLASLSRELAANDARWIDPFTLLGAIEDRNCELVVRAPAG